MCFHGVARKQIAWWEGSRTPKFEDGIGVQKDLGPVRQRFGCPAGVKISSPLHTDAEAVIIV
jgi:hypothetical protein